jgi:hypothetical protein
MNDDAADARAHRVAQAQKLLDLFERAKVAQGAKTQMVGMTKEQVTPRYPPKPKRWSYLMERDCWFLRS